MKSESASGLEQSTSIEIRDPELDSEAILQRLEAQMAQRRAEGAYGRSPALMGPESLRPGRFDRPPEEPAIIRFPGLDRNLIDLVAHARLQEPQFTSSVPVLGPFIIAVRRFWNWMSTKWYVRPVLHQQSKVNVDVGMIISSLLHWQEISAQISAQRLADLQAQVSQLEARLTALENGPGQEGTRQGNQ